MMVKTPITDADSIRALACRALAGLARSEKVRQIISKLPMFTNGQIQSLMKDPILQEKRQEHVTFQKYALELMERVSGKAKPTGAEYEISLVSLHRVSCFKFAYMHKISQNIFFNYEFFEVNLFLASSKYPAFISSIYLFIFSCDYAMFLNEMIFFIG